MDGMDGVVMVRLERSFIRPLCTYPPIALGDSSYSYWVLQCVKEIYPIVGISYAGHEEPFFALLTVIEEEYHREEIGSLSKLGIKGNRELRNLECSINYDARGKCSSHGKGKDRELLLFL
jgi:hypothetical protein